MKWFITRDKKVNNFSLNSIKCHLISLTQTSAGQMGITQTRIPKRFDSFTVFAKLTAVETTVEEFFNQKTTSPLGTRSERLTNPKTIIIKAIIGIINFLKHKLRIKIRIKWIFQVKQKIYRSYWINNNIIYNNNNTNILLE